MSQQDQIKQVLEGPSEAPGEALEALNHLLAYLKPSGGLQMTGKGLQRPQGPEKDVPDAS